MIQFDVTKDIIDIAKSKSIEMGKLNNSITMGDGNLAGFIGEEIVNNFINGRIENTYDYDIICQGKTYDVKTKRCTSPPKTFYDCSVAAFNIKQKCDKYVFVRVQYKNEKYGPAWILGCKDKKAYFENARKLKKGQIDTSNNFIVKADCYNMTIDQLDALEVQNG
jgi:hypothetical protein